MTCFGLVGVERFGTVRAEAGHDHVLDSSKKTARRSVVPVNSSQNYMVSCGVCKDQTVLQFNSLNSHGACLKAMERVCFFLRNACFRLSCDGHVPGKRGNLTGTACQGSGIRTGKHVHESMRAHIL